MSEELNLEKAPETELHKEEEKVVESLTLPEIKKTVEERFEALVAFLTEHGIHFQG